MPRERAVAVAAPEEEIDVQEVRCSVTDTPIPAIPLWYADVKVKFVSDVARTRSGGSTRLSEVLEEEEPEEAEEAEEAESELALDDAETDIVGEDIEMDIDEALEPDEEPEEEAEN
jgi:hypothetical protein